MSSRAKSILVAIIFFLVIVAPIAVVIIKEKYFSAGNTGVIVEDSSKVKK